MLSHTQHFGLCLNGSIHKAKLYKIRVVFALNLAFEEGLAQLCSTFFRIRNFSMSSVTDLFLSCEAVVRWLNAAKWIHHTICSLFYKNSIIAQLPDTHVNNTRCCFLQWVKGQKIKIKSLTGLTQTRWTLCQLVCGKNLRQVINVFKTLFHQVWTGIHCFKVNVINRERTF